MEVRLFILLMWIYATTSSSSPITTTKKPNFVFIMTDDQDTRLGSVDSNYTSLGSVEVMNQTKRLLQSAGVTATNFFVNTPICQ